MMTSEYNIVTNQYTTSRRLETRISIHEKYSRNKQPLAEWIVSHYHLRPSACGLCCVRRHVLAFLRCYL